MRALFSCSAAGITSWRLRACVHSGVCVQSPATQTIPSAGIRMTALVGGCPTPACRCRTVLRGLFALSSDSQVGVEAIVRATSRTSEARRAVLGRARKRTRGGLISTPNAVARAVWSPSLSSSHGAMAAMPETLDRHGAAGLRFAPECARGHRRRQCRCRLGRVGRRWVPRRSRVLGAPGVHTVLFGSLLQAVPNSVCNSTGTAQLVECMYGGVRDFLFTARLP